MNRDYVFSFLIDEANVPVWNEILMLANKYDYEFSKSWKTTSALKRVAKNVHTTAQEWAKTGAIYGAQLGFALCFAYG